MPNASGPVFMILRSRTLFRRCRVRRVPFSCFARPDSFSAAPRAVGFYFTFCAPGLIFGGTEGVGSLFHVFRFRTRFRRYRGRQCPFSCFALPDSFSAVSRVSGPVFMFYAPGLILRRTDGVGSRFHVLRSRTHFKPYSRRWVPFSYFALPDSFSVVLRASGPFFSFCAPGLIFGGTEGVEFLFHVLRSRTHFRRYRGRRVPFSRFALPGSFSAVPRASGSFFTFCALGLIFGGTEGVGSRFHV
jgi:hypothetical protein